LPSWLCPPWSEIGTVLAVQRVLARSENVVLNLSAIRAYRSGCTFQVEIALWPGADDIRDLRALILHSLRPGEALSDRLLRWGVRYAGGTKVTSIDRMDWLDRPAREPAGPLLRSFPYGAGETSLHGGVLLWLWPLPPAEPFELAVEWPMGGIALTMVELDGADIVAAAERSADYWP
jgi:hypothetical protein